MLLTLFRGNIISISVEVGSKVQGKVTGITNFGAFVELPGGSTGMVHISEVVDSYVIDVNDHLKIGDQVEAQALQMADTITAGIVEQFPEKFRI